ncbi:hypothetical protein KAU88_00795 [Candidatus Bathyarchaeota archaeon]|nr:hypothetical protein [Candidatus Bathyarchaeota archaeon]
MDREEMMLSREYELCMEDVRTIEDAQKWDHERFGVFDDHRDLRDDLAWLGEEIGELCKAYLNKSHPGRWWTNTIGEEGIENEITDIFHWCMATSDRLEENLEKLLLKLEGWKKRPTVEEMQTKLAKKYPKETDLVRIIFRISQQYGEVCDNCLKGDFVEASRSLAKILRMCLIASNLTKMDILEVWKKKRVPGK